MSRRVLTVDRYKEIERLLAAGRGVREITRALKCSRRLVRQIRDGLHGPPDQTTPFLSARKVHSSIRGHAPALEHDVIQARSGRARPLGGCINAHIHA